MSYIGGRHSSSARRNESPSYSPPRDRSPSYTAPRERSFSPPQERRSSSPEGPGVSPPRGNPIRLYSSKSPSRRSRSRSPRRSGSGQAYPWQDKEILRTLNCKDCDVCLNDRESMLAHLKGRPHLAQQQRLRDKEIRVRTGGYYGLNEVLRPDNVKMRYDERYWDQNKGKKCLRPEHERFLDTERFYNMPAKFDPRDNGQFKLNKEENYCEKCDVRTKTRDQMQVHKEGANHKKMSAKVQRYTCKLCLIDVPSQDTLDNHMRGEDHIKREKQLQEQRKEKGEIVDTEGYGYKTGPREMAKLNQTEREELDAARKMIKILQEKVKEQNMKITQCRKEHGSTDLVEMRRKLKWCQDMHTRPQEFNRKGIFCKQEEPDDQASTSRRIKGETKFKSERNYNLKPENNLQLANRINSTAYRVKNT